ncbi:hypothetical protein BZG36_04271 [Bifiguratus adelaidae]|uniref:Uncharacterized protein n=1 Tax=Bifiguratus adelaidae TaxID=1938954 RepID=A0A261XWR8_9FUNG|nr:hypothetical protein BZG36_04271 [Bifiguratus adelaidae]
MSSNVLVDHSTLSPKFRELYAKLVDFVDNDCIPAEKLFAEQMGKGDQRWKVIPSVLEELKEKAKSLGLWNMWLHAHYKEGPGFTNLEYALMAEQLGRGLHLASEACNCSAPDTGNMEVFAKYGNEAQKEKWLKPLMEGKIRSAFAMTEKNVASSDATNIETSIVRAGNEYIVNGHKWWISGAGDPRCAVYLVMGKTDPKNSDTHRQQSIIIVPAGTPGCTVVRPMQVFGYDDAPEGHMELIFKDCRVPAENIVLGEGRGFEIIQGRLGPGRIHHCMRSIGVAERALEHMIARVTDPSRRTFGKLLAQHGSIVEGIAKSRNEIDQARFLVLNAAAKIDKVGAKGALKEIGMAKSVVPIMTLQVLDRAIQAHGAGGVSQDFPLAKLWAGTRTLRLADGPDEVHWAQVGKVELRRAEEIREKFKKQSQKAQQMLNRQRYRDMRALLVFYGTMVFVQIFANGNFLPDLSVVRGFAAVYNAVQACTAWVLFYNGVIAFQTIPDGSLLSLLMLTATVLIGFLINLILSIDTFKNFSGQFPPSPNGIDVINVALFVFNLLLPALCVMGYWIMQMVVVLKELSDWSPLLYLAVSVIAFALSEVFIFIVSPYVAAGAHHRADGSFLGTLFMLIAMIFVFQYWWHVTDDEEDDFQLEPTMEESGHQEKRQDNYGSQERLHDIQI